MLYLPYYHHILLYMWINVEMKIKFWKDIVAKLFAIKVILVIKFTCEINKTNKYKINLYM